ncbi:putative electron transport protein [Phaeoacremonium minimum UCRPA7]|uniref:Putative electron transport protein n=1 Tax=Phaeoacremonium minimum (strain UCR-PA7) TaxID=1286976 RepID=R8BPE6_PHAM7|nr:putative electron transport protein [Phaeoacremonium minimum UCRPA7]EOO01217.1 putative electron transport protein [Phaeoacremonium minimum UCRPA7]
MIDFTLTDKQKALRDEAAALAKEILGPARETYEKFHDQESRFRSTLPIYQKLVKAGAVKAQVPVVLGGSNESFIDSAITLEEMYAVDSSVMVHVIGTGLGLLPLIFGGTPEQHEKYLKPFITCEGEPLASLTHSEPGGTANWLEKGGKGLGTTARLEGDYYIVNGEKLWTTNSAGWDGKGATLSCLCCRYSEDGGPEDPNVDPASNTLVLLVTREIVAQNEPGAYQMISEPELMGHIAASGPLSRYTNFKVPAANVLAPRGKGAALVEKAFSVSAALVGAMAVGTMRTAFEAALKFAREDSRGGSVPVLARQSPADLLINAKIKIDTSRILVWKALSGLEKEAGDENSRYEACLQAKVYCSDQAVTAVWETMQLVGV